MVETQYSVIIALTSSLGTVILSKIADILLTNRQFKQQLYKIYFERKITASEQIIGGLNIMIGALWNCKNMFDLLSKSENNQTEEDDLTVDHIQSALNAQMEKSNSSYQYVIAALPYYYDFEDITHQLIESYDRILATAILLNKANIKNDSNNEHNLAPIYNQLSIEYNEMIQVVNLAMKRIRDVAKKFEFN